MIEGKQNCTIFPQNNVHYSVSKIYNLAMGIQCTQKFNTKMLYENNMVKGSGNEGGDKHCFSRRTFV
jgi:hypothetical protein